ncbi:MAG: MerR family transcriptional regulator [bacterium]
MYIVVQPLYLDSPAVDAKLPTSPEQELYRIGTVASLTGLSVERLRAWERRYELSPAHKSGKTRFYSREQLQQLQLIKHLIDQGQPISSLASLTMAQLEARIDSQPAQPVIASLHAPTVGLIGANLVTLEQQEQERETPRRIDVISRWANMTAFTTEQKQAPDALVEPRVLVVQLPVLSEQPIEKIRHSFPNAKLVMIYQFTMADALSAFEEAGIPTLKWPVSWQEIEHTVISESGQPARAGRQVPRRYSDEELIAIGSQDDDPTQCPQHLVEAIHQLNALASFAADCAQEQASPQPLLNVQSDISQARAHLEVALGTLLNDGDISLVG